MYYLIIIYLLFIIIYVLLFIIYYLVIVLIYKCSCVKYIVVQGVPFNFEDDKISHAGLKLEKLKKCLDKSCLVPKAAKLHFGG